VEREREAGDSDWYSRTSAARERLHESLQPEVARREEAPELNPWLEAIKKEIEIMEGRGPDEMPQQAMVEIEPSKESAPEKVSERQSEVVEEIERSAEARTSETNRLSFTSMEEVDRAIEQHQHIEKTLSEERYDETKAYIEVINSPEMSTEELSEKLGIDEDQVARLRAEKTTTLISSLELQEEKRIEHERLVSDEALEHRIDPGVVHELAIEIVEQEGLETSELTDFVEALYQSIESREKESVHYAELYDTGESLVTDRLRDLAGEIRANREDIERELNVRLGLDSDPEYELRIAVTDDRLYYWHVSTSPDRWLNVLAGEAFYFQGKEDKYELLDDLQKHLHVRGGPQQAEYYLNDVLNQFNRAEGVPINRVRRYGEPYYLDGEALHFIADTLGQGLEDLKPRLSHLGMKEAGQVTDLRFPDIHVFRMKKVRMNSRTASAGAAF